MWWLGLLIAGRLAVVRDARHVGQFVKLLADLEGLGVSKFVKDGQGALPGGSCGGGGGAAVSDVSVAEAGQDVGLAVTEPEFAI